jgi:hypothetical protein
MARDPAVRPQTMTELEEALLAIAARHFSGTSSDRMSALTPRPLALAGIPGSVVQVWGRLAADRRKLAGAGAAAVLAVSLVVFGLSRAGGGGSAAALTSAPPALVAESEATAAIARQGAADRSLIATTAAGAAPGLAPPGGAADEAAPSAGGGVDGAEGQAAAASTARPRAGSAGPGATTSAADSKKKLAEAQQLLRAQRFAEAREAFAKLAKQRPTRAAALLALAEIAFQEKNYEEAVRSARLAAERGGGARARVVLGDAHFRMSRYQDAASAYQQALRLDPKNPSAKSGLAAASKRL